jgi:hypothetical protein
MVLYWGVNGTQLYKLIRAFENLIYAHLHSRIGNVKDPGVGTRM